MAITDEQYFDGLLEAASATLNRARELERRFRKWGLMPQELAGVPDEELVREVRKRGLTVSAVERSSDA